MRLSVIIPVYNEEQTIHDVLERVAAVDLGGIELEIVVANDGSTDGTRRATAGCRRICRCMSTTARSTSERARPSASDWPSPPATSC
jgi:hypothetical protein